MIVDSNGVIVDTPRSPGNYDADAVSAATGLVCLDPSRTQQQFKDECDINVILERFGVTGHLPIVSVQPMQGDFTNISDYHTMVETLRASQDNFMALPSKVREKFDNDPRKFVDFCVDPANIEVVRELGLAPRPGEPGIIDVMKEIRDGLRKANGAAAAAGGNQNA